jgi:hypothetical protein
VTDLYDLDDERIKEDEVTPILVRSRSPPTDVGNPR